MPRLPPPLSGYRLRPGRDHDPTLPATALVARLFKERLTCEVFVREPGWRATTARPSWWPCSNPSPTRRTMPRASRRPHRRPRIPHRHRAGLRPLAHPDPTTGRAARTRSRRTGHSRRPTGRLPHHERLRRSIPPPNRPDTRRLLPPPAPVATGPQSCQHSRSAEVPMRTMPTGQQQPVRTTVSIVTGVPLNPSPIGVGLPCALSWGRPGMAAADSASS